MKVAYITTYDASDIHNWSGIGYYLGKAIDNQQAEIEYIGNLETRLNPYLKLKQKLYRRFSDKQFDISRDPYVAGQYAKQVQQRLSPGTDVIFSPGSIPIALLKTKQPKAFYTDATFAGMLGFYDDFSNLCAETIRHGNMLEKAALDSSSVVIYSSQWAAQSAIAHYQVDPSKIRVVPFGANIVCKRNAGDIRQLATARPADTLHLLFIGVDWKRKGGERAVKIAGALNAIGVKTRLHMAGIRRIPMDPVPDFVVNHGYISKGTQEGVDKIERLFRESHFFMLPSVADCTPIVVSEANAYGLPCMTTNVGGIPSLIDHDINGKTWDLDADIKDWAGYIADAFMDRNRYLDFCLSSFGVYENKLNWDVAGKEVMRILGDL